MKIPRVVWLLSLVSLFNDIASEMLYPIIPIFITQVLGAPVAVLGLIEGVAEGSAAFFKTIFGYLSDQLQKRKPFVVLGYFSSGLAKIIIAFSLSWPMVFLGRFIDRLGKGVRTGARDALLLEAAENSNRGLIFGFHRAMYSAGAVIGPIIALLLLYFFHNNIRLILYLAIIPAFLSLIFFVFIKEGKRKVETTKVKISFSLKKLPGQFKIFLLGMAIFSLGNSSDSFIILRAKTLGLDLMLVISAYILYNLVYSLASTPAGRISDKIGAKKVFLLGIFIYALVYLGFAFNIKPILVWPFFAIYGFYIALTDGVAKALIGSYIPKEKAATAYGVFYTISSICTLLASVIGGLLWSLVSPSFTFVFAAVCALFSLLVFFALD